MQTGRKKKIKLSPGRMIALGFAGVIALGTILLLLPISIKSGVQISVIDALFTATSAVCVTGLLAVDVADSFTAFGQMVVAVLIQVGGLGVASVGVTAFLAMGRRVGLWERKLVQEAMSLSTSNGIIHIIKNVLWITVCLEGLGAAFSYPVFRREYPPLRALGVSLFHSIAAFNNAGFDILGGFRSLTSYENNVLLNVTTCLLIFFGGIGFLVILDLLHTKSLKKLQFHSKVVLSMSAILVGAGMVLIKLTEKQVSWMGALFLSVSARTAGFSTYSLNTFSNGSLLVIMFLMVIGASPGSTGGGIRTSTLFALLQTVKVAATNRSGHSFHYRLSRDTFYKASVILILAGFILCSGTFLLTIFEPEIALRDILFEITSAFGTAGLSTGITPELSMPSKILEIVIMYIGRLGVLTIASLWTFHQEEHVFYPEGNLLIG